MSDATGRALCKNTSLAFEGSRIDCVKKVIEDVLRSIIIDLNHDIEQGTFSDYKSDLKSKSSVEKALAELLRVYEKDKARGKADDIGARLSKCGIK